MINVEASRSIAQLCAERSILLIYISTDYIFPGKPGDAPYEADADPAPTNLYGQTKLDGERAVLQEFKAADKEGLGVVLRVPVLYGQAKTNAESAVNCLVDTVLEAQKEGAKIKMDHWALRFPTNTEDVARVCYGMILSSCYDFSLRMLLIITITRRGRKIPRNGRKVYPASDTTIL